LEANEAVPAKFETRERILFVAMDAETAATRESRAGKADPEQQRAVDREAADTWGRERSTPSDRGLRLIEKIDLLVTKQNTTRITDVTDIKFLDEQIEKQYRPRLMNCNEKEAREMFERFATPEIAAYAIRENRD
jgi:hypothetical protein